MIELHPWINTHPDSREILDELFGEREEYTGYRVVLRDTDSWPLRIMQIEGMEAYPRLHRGIFAREDALVLIYGDQIDTLVRSRVGRGEQSPTWSVKHQGYVPTHETGGRMFDDKYKHTDFKDYAGHTYLGDKIIECPFSGMIQYEHGEVCVSLSDRELSVMHVDKETRRKLESLYSYSPVKYKRLTDAKSRKEALKAFKDQKESDVAFYHPRLWETKEKAKRRKSQATEEKEAMLSFMRSCGVRLGRGKVRVLKKDKLKSAERHVRRRKKLTKSEQSFFSTLLGASKLSKLMEA